MSVKTNKLWQAEAKRERISAISHAVVCLESGRFGLQFPQIGGQLDPSPPPGL